MSDQLQLRSTSFVAGQGVLASYMTSLRNNDLYLGRCRWTSGDPVLEQADCEQGALYAHATDALLYFYRISGTGTADDTTRKGLAAPIRAIWHYDDRTGAPETDGRSKKGDLLVFDDATNDRYLAVCTGAGTYGLGVRADYRTAATSGSQTQVSDSVAMRGSVWDTGAAKYRQARLSVTPQTSGTLLDVRTLSEGGTERLAFRFVDTTSTSLELWGNPTGNVVPGFKYSRDRTGSSPGQISCTFSTESTDTDGSQVWFHHGDPTRFARHRFRGTTAGDTGSDAEVLGISYRTDATSLATMRNSPSLTHLGSYWDGAVGVETSAYSQLILTSTTPASYMSHGFSHGVGTFDHYSDGAAVFHIDFDGTSTYGGALSIRASTAANASLPTNHSPYFHAIGRSGSSDANRGIAWNTQIDSSADASDLWSMRMVATSSGAPTDVIGIRHTGEILPADVSGHAIEFTTALGTHAKTTASDKTGNAKVGTIKVKLSDGSTAHLQLYAD